MLSTLLRNILTLPTLGQDGPQKGLNKENRVVSQLFFYALILHSTLRLDSVYGIKKPESFDSGFPCSGDRTRTCGLRVMSPTSYQLLHPAIYVETCCFPYWDYKDMNFFGFCKIMFGEKSLSDRRPCAKFFF